MPFINRSITKIVIINLTVKLSTKGIINNDNPKKKISSLLFPMLLSCTKFLNIIYLPSLKYAFITGNNLNTPSNQKYKLK